MAKLTDVVVKPPADRIADLYETVARRNRPKPGATTHPRDEIPGDLQDLVRMFREFAQDIFRHAA